MILEVFLYVYCLLYLVPPEFFVCSAQTFRCGYYIWSDGLYLSETSGSWETNLLIFQGLFLLALPSLYLFILFCLPKTLVEHQKQNENGNPWAKGKFKQVESEGRMKQREATRPYSLRGQPVMSPVFP